MTTARIRAKREMFMIALLLSSQAIRYQYVPIRVSPRVARLGSRFRHSAENALGTGRLVSALRHEEECHG